MASDPNGPVAYLWSYVVKPEHIPAFRAAYGPAGVWAAFFSQSPGYLGTQLLESADEPGRFLTIDTFATAEARDELIAAKGADYAALDARWATATDDETFLGAYRLHRAAEPPAL